MIESVTCPVCSEWNLSSDNFCMNCGTSLRRDSGSARADMDEAGNGEVSGPMRLFGRPESHRSGTRGLVHAVAFRTDVGLSHHTNQDAIGAWSWTRSDGTAASLLAVADGVSAGRHSEEASALALAIVYDRVAGPARDARVHMSELQAALVEAARLANREIARRPYSSLSSADATTLVSAVCVGASGIGVWCGDSRAYKLGPSGVKRLTHDHSWAEQVVQLGLMTADAAAADPRAHMITKWLGPPPQDDPGIETFSFELLAGEALLCCTDGLYGYFGPPVASNEEEMATVLMSANGDVQAGVDSLVQLALQRGGRDNISGAILYGVADPSRETVHLSPEQNGAERHAQTLHLRFPLYPEN